MPAGELGGNKTKPQCPPPSAPTRSTSRPTVLSGPASGGKRHGRRNSGPGARDARPSGRVSNEDPAAVDAATSRLVGSPSTKGPRTSSAASAVLGRASRSPVDRRSLGPLRLSCRSTPSVSTPPTGPRDGTWTSGRPKALPASSRQTGMPVSVSGGARPRGTVPHAPAVRSPTRAATGADQAATGRRVVADSDCTTGEGPCTSREAALHFRGTQLHHRGTKAAPQGKPDCTTGERIASRVVVPVGLRPRRILSSIFLHDDVEHTSWWTTSGQGRRDAPPHRRRRFAVGLDD